MDNCAHDHNWICWRCDESVPKYSMETYPPAPSPTLEEWVDLYYAAKEKYYAGEPIMLDSTFDHLEDRIRKMCPDHPCLQKVGA